MAYQLVDPYGRPVRTQALTERQAEAGLTGVRQAWAGTVASGLTPQRLAALLLACDQGQTEAFVTLAEEMEERDPHYFSVLGMRKRAVSGVRASVTPATEDAADVKIADAVRAAIADHDGFADLVEDLLDALGKGFAAVEIDWDRSAREWTPARFEHVPQRFFQFDRETGREMRLRDTANPTDGIEMAPFKFIRHVARMKSGLAYRGGLARVVSFGWMCKAYGLKDWVAFVETFGLPIRLGRYGPEATAADVQTLFGAVANIGTDAAAVLPESMNIEFAEAGNGNGTGGQIFENLARWVDEQVSKAVLGQTMTSDNGSSMSQAQVHNEVRHDIAKADARSVSGAINRDLVRAFVDLNFGVQGAYPRLVIEVQEPEDTKALMESVGILLPFGARFNASELRAKLGLTDPDDNDEVIGGTPAPAPVSAVPGGTPSRVVPLPKARAVNASAAPSAAAGGADVLGEIELGMLDDWEAVMEDVLSPFEAALAGATGYEDAKARLAAALPGLPSSRLIDALVRGAFKARALGDVRDGDVRDGGA